MLRYHYGFTLVEVLIVVFIMAILAATILPQFADATKDAKVATAIFNLNTLRAQVQFYKSQHQGRLPGPALLELTSKTDVNGTIGTTSAHVHGPYLASLPENPITGSTTIRATPTNPPASASGAANAGWLYHSGSGGVWLDDPNLLSE